MKLRNLKKTDIIFCSEIVGKAFSKEYVSNSKKEIAEMFSKSIIKPKYIVAEENKKIVGFGGYIQSFMDWGFINYFGFLFFLNFNEKALEQKLLIQ